MSANPSNAALIEDLGHVINPSKHFLFIAGGDLDITSTGALGAPSTEIYVGGTAGNITLTDCRGVSVTYAVATGATIKGVFVTVVNATTTATGIVVRGK